MEDSKTKEKEKANETRKFMDNLQGQEHLMTIPTKQSLFC